MNYIHLFEEFSNRFSSIGSVSRQEFKKFSDSHTPIMGRSSYKKVCDKIFNKIHKNPEINPPLKEGMPEDKWIPVINFMIREYSFGIILYEDDYYLVSMIDSTRHGNMAHGTGNYWILDQNYQLDEWLSDLHNFVYQPQFA
jgi:hypothetical protein